LKSDRGVPHRIADDFGNSQFADWLAEILCENIGNGFQLRYRNSETR